MARFKEYDGSQVLLECRELELITGEMFAIDGCKLPANVSKERSGILTSLKKKKSDLEKLTAKIVLKHREMDKDESAKIKGPHGYIQGYNGTAAADSGNQAIVCAEAAGNSESGSFPGMPDSLEENMKAVTGKEKPLKKNQIRRAGEEIVSKWTFSTASTNGIRNTPYNWYENIKENKM
jgi:hypothetical protein